MSKQLNITVAAPAHSGVLSAAVLLKVLLGNALPGTQIELLNEAGSVDELNAFFVERDIAIRIAAQNSAG